MFVYAYMCIPDIQHSTHEAHSAQALNIENRAYGFHVIVIFTLDTLNVLEFNSLSTFGRIHYTCESPVTLIVYIYLYVYVDLLAYTLIHVYTSVHTCMISK